MIISFFISVNHAKIGNYYKANKNRATEISRPIGIISWSD